MTAQCVEGRFAVDPGMRVIEWDDGASALLGMPKEGALGNPCFDVVRGRDDFWQPVCGPDCPNLRALRQGHLTTFSTLVASTPAGRRVRLRCELTALPFPPGGALGKLCGSDNWTPSLADDLAGVATLTTRISASSLQQGMEQALDLLLKATAADAAEVFLAEPEGRGMVLTSHRGRFRRAFTQILRFDRGEGFPGLVLETGEPVFSVELAEDHRFLRTRVKEQGFSAYICSPLASLTNVVGSIGVAFRRPDVNLDRNLRLLHWVSAPLSLLVQAGLSRLRERIYKTGVPHSDFHQTLSVVLNEMTRMAEADGGELYLLGRGTAGYHLTYGLRAVTHCPLLEETMPFRCPALTKGQGVVLFGDRTLWPASCQETAYPNSTWYCVPLLADGEKVGIVRLVHRKAERPLPSSNMVLLENMAEAAANVIRDGQKGLERGRCIDTALRKWLQQATTGPEVARPSASKEEAVPLEVRCLGPFELYVQGKAITPPMVPRKKALTLLKILIAHNGRPQPKEVLMEMLWPEGDPASRTSQFYVLVHELRRLVEPGRRRGGWTFICNEGDRYYFNLQSPCRVDTEEFKALMRLGEKAETAGDEEAAVAAYERAAEIYRGDFMEDEPFADWCWQKREQLREMCLSVLKRLATLYGRAGNWEGSVRCLRRALTLDPLREEVHRELMYALWCAGRRDEAVRQYEVCSRLLREELDVAPSPETQGLLQQVRASPSPLQSL